MQSCYCLTFFHFIIIESMCVCVCVCFHVYICVCVCGMTHFCNSCLSHAGCVCDVQTPDCHCRPPVAHCHHVWHSAFAYLPPQ